MRRFVETAGLRAFGGDLNYAERMRRAMLEGALACFAQVCKAHFSVEELYMRAMDFEAKETFTRAFCTTLFKEE